MNRTGSLIARGRTLDAGVRKRRKRPEQTLQIACAGFLRLALREPTWWSAIDHGAGKMTKAAAGIRKAMGVKRGIADLLIIHRHEKLLIPLVVWIELKSEDGDQSEPQDTFQEAMETNGCMYHVARSVDEVEGFLRGVGIPLHATTYSKDEMWF